MTASAPAPETAPNSCFSAEDGRLLLEVLDDDLVHAELGEGDCAAPLPAIDASPMVAKLDHTGPRQFAFDGEHSFRTGELEMVVDPETLCLTATRIGPPALRLTTLCSFEPTRKTRALALTPETFTHACGLGENFVEIGSTDGDWVGRDRLSGPFGNVQDGWNNGAVGNDQYPVAFFAGGSSICRRPRTGR